MSRYFRSLLVGALAPIVMSSLAHGAEVRIVSWGGAVNDAYRAAMWEPFAKASGVKLIEDVYTSSER